MTPPDTLSRLRQLAHDMDAACEPDAADVLRRLADALASAEALPPAVVCLAMVDDAEPFRLPLSATVH